MTVSSPRFHLVDRDADFYNGFEAVAKRFSGAAAAVGTVFGGAYDFGVVATRAGDEGGVGGSGVDDLFRGGAKGVVISCGGENVG